jgi:hypothetical protein
MLAKGHVVLCNCRHTAKTAQTLGFQTFPMVLMYFRGRMVFAGNTFANCRKTRAAFLETVNDYHRKAMSGILLPEEFGFESRFFSGAGRNFRGISEQHHCVWGGGDDRTKVSMY